MNSFGLGTGGAQTPLQAYEEQYRAIRAQAQQLVSRLRDLEALRMANPEIEQAFEATAPDEVLPGTTLQKRAALEGALLAESLGQWLESTLPGDLTPFIVINRRG